MRLLNWLIDLNSKCLMQGKESEGSEDDEKDEDGDEE